MPDAFDVLGVAASMVAIVNGAHWRGSLVVTLSTVGALVGYCGASVL